MIWLSVFPTLTVINLALGDWLKTLSPVVRTFVLATIAVPIVIYGLMPHMHRLRARLMATTGKAWHSVAAAMLARSLIHRIGASDWCPEPSA